MHYLSPDYGVIICDGLGRIRFIDKKAAFFWGIKPVEALGRQIKDFVLFSIDEIREESSKSGFFSVQKIYKTILFEVMEQRNKDFSSDLEIDLVYIQLSLVSNENLACPKSIKWDRPISVINNSMPTILHRFKNSLAGITTALELIIEEVSSPNEFDSLVEILNEIKCMHLFLDGFSMGHKSIQGKHLINVESEILEVITLLDFCKVIENINFQFVSKNLIPISINRSVLRAILFNLATNSIDACKPNDLITIKAELIEEEKKFLSIEVADTGKGMSPDLLEKCTEPFFTTKERGSGLGLSLCKSIVESNQGIFELKSEEEHGTHVYLIIPLN